MRMRLANAPVSWGVEFGFEPPIAYGLMLDELRRAGYDGTELGPYGYMPTDPEILGRELEKRSLRLVSAFVPIELKARAPSLEELERVVSLLDALGASHVILADAQCSERARVAGRASESGVRLSEREWAHVEANVVRACELVERRGLRPILHHHAGTHIETPEEVARLLDRTPVGLCLDTGHYVYGGGDPLEAVRAFHSRIDYLHLKDVDPGRFEQVRRDKLDFNDGVAAGVFCPLGRGCVPFAEILGELDRFEFDGWAVVEQDADPTGEGAYDPLEAACCSRDYLLSLLDE